MYKLNILTETCEKAVDLCVMGQEISVVPKDSLHPDLTICMIFQQCQRIHHAALRTTVTIYMLTQQID